MRKALVSSCALTLLRFIVVFLLAGAVVAAAREAQASAFSLRLGKHPDYDRCNIEMEWLFVDPK